MNTGIENHTFLKETDFFNRNMDMHTHITLFLLKEIYGKLINIYNESILRFVLSTSSKSLVSTQSFTACGIPPKIIYRRIYSIIFLCSD